MTTTVDRLEAAEAIATAVLDARAAACVQIGGPVTSRYWWNNEQTTTQEYLIVAKTTEQSARAVQDLIKRAHPYDVPEILVTAVVDGHGPYLDWVASEIKLA